MTGREEMLNATMLENRQAKPCDIPIIEKPKLDVGAIYYMLSYSRLSVEMKQLVYNNIIEYEVIVSKVEGDRIFVQKEMSELGKLLHPFRPTIDFLLADKYIYESDTHLFVECVDMWVKKEDEEHTPIVPGFDLVLVAVEK